MKKNFLKMRLLFTMLLFVTSMIMPSMMWAQRIRPAMPDGNGSAESPYLISNAAELYGFAGLVNGTFTNGGIVEESYKSAHAKLTADITVNKGVLDANKDLVSGSDFIEWTPIGNRDNQYNGFFDGNGHTVSGLYFNDKSISYVGLFGCIGENGKISNVGVLDSYFNFSTQGGGVCGSNYGKLQNCSNSSTVIGCSHGGTGGVCGTNSGTVTDCKNTGSVRGSSNWVGGVCGCNYATITNCFNAGNVSGNEYVGGVCGCNYERDLRGTITNCFNGGTVSGNEEVGGVCGVNYSTIINCFNEGTVNCNSNVVGGVCGTNKSTITNCFNAGNVIKNGAWIVGGVCGDDNGTITNCYYLSGTATGGIYGNDKKGSAEPMSKDQFNSGEVTYLLNEGNVFGEQAWGQQLGTDQYPVLGSDYKVIMAAQGNKDANGNDTYWATFSNLTNDVTLSVPSGRTLKVYNATVSGGKMTLTQRSDNQVATKEGVLLKTDGEYVNAKANETNGLTKASSDENLLVATPAKATTVTADAGYKLYRLTYNNATTKEDLGFYLSVDKENTSAANGTSLKATPGKAYLKVREAEAKDPSSAALARSFVFGNDSETTGIEGITIIGTDLQHHNTHEGIFDLQGRKISTPTKGIYIKNNKKVIIK